MNRVYLDFETRSELDLPKVGAALYAQHASTDVLCLAFSESEDPIGDIFLLKGLAGKYTHGAHIGEWFGELEDHCKGSAVMNDDAAKLYELAADPNTVFVAHNAIFEQMIWKHIMVKRYGYPEIPIERWVCTMAKAFAHGWPGALKACASAMNLSQLKDDKGKALINKLSKPRKIGKKNSDPWWTPETAPQDFQDLYDYCIQDLRPTMEIDRLLRDLSPIEHRLWCIDQRMNQAGLYVDRELIAKALDFVTRAKAEIKAGFSKLVNDACKPTQRTLYADWLWLEGVDVANTKKHTLKAVLETDLDDNVRESIVLFGEANKTSVAKLSSMLTRSDEQGCMRELVQYHGAHTGRWAGRGVQIQNMIRPKYDIKPVVAALQEFDYYTFKMLYDDVIDRISNCSRAFIVAPPDGEHELYIADFEQIESRATAWLAGQQDMLDTFAAGEDIYCKEATGIFGYTITKKENEKRQVGKVGTLSLGYEGGIGAFVKMGANYNLDLRPIAKQTWMSASPDERESAEWHYMIYLKNHEKSKSEEAPVGLAEGLTADIIKQRWRASHPKIVQFWRDVEAAAIEAVQTKKLVKCGKVAFFIHDRYLVCKLPSGRNLCYPYPALKLGRKGKMKLSYRVMHQGRWIRNDTYGGALTENIVQAVSRDLLRDAMLRCEDRYPVAATIHDEMIAIVRKGTGDVQEFIDLMKELPEWAAGLPVGVAGWASERYGKD